MSTKPFRLKVKLQNNRLVKAREDLLLTQAEAARRIGISNSALSSLENFRYADAPEGSNAPRPWGERGWTETALRVADYYGYSPEFLWPEEIAAVRKNAFVLEVNAAEAHVLVGGELEHRELIEQVQKARELMSPREQHVLDARFVEEMDLSKIGRGMGRSMGRARQIQEQAFGRVRKAYTLSEDGDLVRKIGGSQ